MKRLIILLFSSFLISCESFEIGPDANDLFHVKVGDAILPVLVKGNTASGKIILFVNGGPGLTSIDVGESNLLNWDKIESGFAIAYLDQRGTGNSQGNFKVESVNNQQYVLDIQATIRVLKAKYGSPDIILMSHSYGGYTCGEYLSQGRGGVEGWINIDGLAVPRTEDMWVYRHEFLVNIAMQKIQNGEDSAYWQQALDWALANPVIETDGQKDVWRSYIGSRPGEGVIPEENVSLSATQILNSVFFSSYNPVPAYIAGKWKTVLRNLFDEVDEDNQISRLSAVDVPTLNLWGRYDELIPAEMGRDVHDTLSTPEALKKFVLFERSGHQPFVNEEEKFREEVVGFVQSL